VCKVFPDAYSAGTAEDIPESLRRMMNPGTAIDHWAQFCGNNIVGQLDDVDFDHEEDDDDEDAIEEVDSGGGED
jgi:hypothetical protein